LEGWAMMRHLEGAHGGTSHIHPELNVEPAKDSRLPAADPSPEAVAAVEIPILFRTYLRYGSKVCGPPAIDREFKTIDYFVVLDVETLSPRTHAIFFG
jgi:putative hemolysin